MHDHGQLTRPDQTSESQGKFLIGRDRELVKVAFLLDRLHAGVGENLIVTGPPGAGKIALMTAVAELAADCGIRVARTGRIEPTRALPRSHRRTQVSQCSCSLTLLASAT
ncbi:ATP-binding protein [Streptomyces sp. NPDC046977]|uniref:ATP-binding protein n=1 Tax=Streptomyces sp. NPDC046977 TaxID=3154703 RepID=UPI0033ECD3D7